MNDAPRDDGSRKAGAMGGCLCGAVRYRIVTPLREVVACHCGQCQRSHGGYGAYSATERNGLELAEDGGLKWYESSPGVRRGFCGTCGGRLFWDDRRRDYIAVAAGTLDPPSGLRLVRHIYVADKPDFYEISDGLEQRPQSLGAG